MNNRKRGSAKVYLIVIVLIALAVGFFFLRLNWRRFKVEADYGFNVAVMIIAVLLVIFLMIRHSIRKAKKQKEKERARLEKERLEAERIAAGGKPSTLGNGKLEISDVEEIAGKAMDRVDDFLSKKE